MPTKEHLHVRRQRDGFIPVEQPVVIAIIASLAGMLLPVLAKARTTAQDINECVRRRLVNALFGRFDMANPADPSVGGMHVLPVHLLPSCTSYCS